MAHKRVLEAVRDTLFSEMERDESVIVFGEDIAIKGGVFGATAGLLSRYGEQRVFDTPVAESLIVGLAIGASIHGLRPVAEIQFGDFIHLAVDQIINEAAKMRYRSYGAFTCPLVIRAPYGGGIHGGLYHSQSVEALFCSTPGLRVVAPSTPRDVTGMLRAAIRCDDPVLFLEHKATYRSVTGEVPDEDFVLPLDRADVKRNGHDVSVVTYGLMLHRSLNAAEKLAGEGIDVEIVDLRTLYPPDGETVLASVQKTGKLLLVYEDNRTGAAPGEIDAIVAEEGFQFLDAPIRRLGGPDVPAMPFAEPLEAAFLVSQDQIERAIRELVTY